MERIVLGRWFERPYRAYEDYPEGAVRLPEELADAIIGPAGHLKHAGVST